MTPDQQTAATDNALVEQRHRQKLADLMNVEQGRDYWVAEDFSPDSRDALQRVALQQIANADAAARATSGYDLHCKLAIITCDDTQPAEGAKG